MPATPADLLIAPLTLALLAAALMVLAWRRWRWIARLAGVMLAVALLAMSPAGANGLLWLVETPVAAAPCQSEPDRVHVLLAGGFHRDPEDGQDIAALTASSLLRTTRFARRYATADERVVVVAGGGVPVAESTVIAWLLEREGVAATRLRLERGSRNTWASAQAVASEQAALGKRIVLSTSALHMRRATLSFEAFGYDVCESPLFSDVVVPDHPATLVPQALAARKAESVIHELAGWLAYRWRAARLPRSGAGPVSG